jgi:hypothetical protein
MRLTPDEKHKIERLAAREGTTAKVALLKAVDQALHESSIDNTEALLDLAQSVYAALDEVSRNEVERIVLDRSQFFDRKTP